MIWPSCEAAPGYSEPARARVRPTFQVSIVLELSFSNRAASLLRARARAVDHAASRVAARPGSPPAMQRDAPAPKITEVLPKAGLVYSEKGNLGEVLIRCNNVLYLRGVPEEDEAS